MNNVSIIIRCKDDFRVIDTINSIDYPSEIIVTLVPNTKIRDTLKKMNIIVIEVPDNNTGLANNIGLENASNECCIIMDSDSVFMKGYIKKCSDAINNGYDIARGKIIFDFSKNNFISKIIASARDYFNNICQLPYSPGLAIRKSFAVRICGFNEKIRWSTDDEFSRRFIDNGARYFFIDDVFIKHAPISFKHDLKAAYRTGIATKDLHLQNNFILKGILNNRFKSILYSYNYEPYKSIYINCGFFVMVYHFIWVCAYNWGYWSIKK